MYQNRILKQDLCSCNFHIFRFSRCIVFCPNIVQITMCWHVIPCHTSPSTIHEVVDESLRKICHYQQNVPQHYYLLDALICNSNWTEWSTIQGVIARVISKSDEREARGRFEITSTITP